MNYRNGDCPETDEQMYRHVDRSAGFRLKAVQRRQWEEFLAQKAAELHRTRMTEEVEE